MNEHERLVWQTLSRGAAEYLGIDIKSYGSSQKHINYMINNDINVCRLWVSLWSEGKIALLYWIYALLLTLRWRTVLLFGHSNRRCRNSSNRPTLMLVGYTLCKSRGVRTGDIYSVLSPLSTQTLQGSLQFSLACNNFFLNFKYLIGWPGWNLTSLNGHAVWNCLKKVKVKTLTKCMRLLIHKFD